MNMHRDHRRPLHRHVKDIVTRIIKEITDKYPRGTLFYYGLPKTNIKNYHVRTQLMLRQYLTQTIYDSCYTPEFIAMLLTAAFDENGRPLSHSPLFSWLLDNVYGDDVQLMYTDWLKVKDSVYDHQIKKVLYVNSYSKRQ